MLKYAQVFHNIVCITNIILLKVKHTKIHEIYNEIGENHTNICLNTTKRITLNENTTKMYKITPKRLHFSKITPYINSVRMTLKHTPKVILEFIQSMLTLIFQDLLK